MGTPRPLTSADLDQFVAHHERLVVLNRLDQAIAVAQKEWEHDVRTAFLKLVASYYEQLETPEGTAEWAALHLQFLELRHMQCSALLLFYIHYYAFFTLKETDDQSDLLSLHYQDAMTAEACILQGTSHQTALAVLEHAFQTLPTKV